MWYFSYLSRLVDFSSEKYFMAKCDLELDSQIDRSLVFHFIYRSFKFVMICSKYSSFPIYHRFPRKAIMDGVYIQFCNDTAWFGKIKLWKSMILLYYFFLYPGFPSQKIYSTEQNPQLIRCDERVTSNKINIKMRK